MVPVDRRQFLALAVTALSSCGVFTRAHGHEKHAIPSARTRLRLKYFPDVVLHTHEGKRVRFYQDLIKDKAVMINFMYATCTDVCPWITANLVRVQKLLSHRIGRDLFMYSITLEPERDTPEVLHRYARQFGVQPGWTFLTGKPDDIELLRQSLGFTDPDPVLDKDINSHAGTVRYGHEPRMLWAGCSGLADPQWISERVASILPPSQNGGS